MLIWADLDLATIIIMPMSKSASISGKMYLVLSLIGLVTIYKY